MPGEVSLSPLQGTRVLGFTQFLLGPACTRYLADLGADVVKVEPLRGAWERHWAGAEATVDGVSMFFLAANGSARSIALDLKSPEGQEVVDRLVADADVVVTNYRPTAARRLGITLERLRKCNPQIVLAKASAYGDRPGWEELPGQDLLLQARSGLMSLTGSDAPAPCGAPVVDQHAAALLGMAVLSGLLERQRTKSAVEVEVTMMSAALDLLTEPLAYAANGGNFDDRHGGLGSRFHPAPYGSYAVEDGYIVVSLSPIEALAAALDDPDLAQMAHAPDAYSARRHIYDRVAQAVRGQTVASILERLRATGVWCERVSEIHEVEMDPWVQERQWFQQAGTGEDLRYKTPRTPLDDPDGAEPARSPTVGEHTDEILAEVGYTPPDIEGLHERGTVS